MTEVEFIGGHDNVLKDVFEALEIAEGYVRAAVWREESEPPYERGKAANDWAKVHAALAALQLDMRASPASAFTPALCTPTENTGK